MFSFDGVSQGVGAGGREQDERKQPGYHLRAHAGPRAPDGSRGLALVAGGLPVPGAGRGVADPLPPVHPAAALHLPATAGSPQERPLTARHQRGQGLLPIRTQFKHRMAAVRGADSEEASDECESLLGISASCQPMLLLGDCTAK